MNILRTSLFLPTMQTQLFVLTDEKSHDVQISFK